MIEPSDLARLSQWAVERADDRAVRQRITSHPRFPEAVRLLAARILATCDDDKTLDGIFKDGGRYAAALCAVHLHLSGELTLPRLKQLCARSGWASPGRARALLLYLRYLGYVELVFSSRKGKAALYAPTARFLAAWRIHLEVGLDAAALIEPAVAHLRDRLMAPDLFELFARTDAAGLLASSQLMQQEGAFVRAILHRNAGFQLVCNLLTSNSGGAFPPRKRIPISLATCARRFSVSRIHIRRILNTAEREGLLKYEREGWVTLTKKGRSDIEDFFAEQLIQLIGSAARTFAAEPALHLRVLPPGKRGLDHLAGTQHPAAEAECC